ncbi:hypothetical protein [Microbacterium sp. NPDC089695]|uniref:hypothetical protein n=1 Tax=Microbacterium sp. NPDC089695 TaxID=3364198 RepID=UPI00381E6A11
MWSVRTPAPVRVPHLCRWLLLAGWPVHLVFAALVAGTTALGMAMGQSAIVSSAVTVAVHYAAGVWASFVVHELGHLVALSRSRGVTALTLERGIWRLSISPHGDLRPAETLTAAVAGPGICVIVGAALWVGAADLHLHGWYIAHAVFLLPAFGDGRAAVTASRGILRHRGHLSAGDEDHTP